MEALSAFLLASLVPADAGDMLKRVASEMRYAPVELGHWLINKREAQRSSDVVASRQEAGSFVLTTRLGLQEKADHPKWDGTVARALFDQLMNHGRRSSRRRKSYQQTQQFALAQRVTRYDASNVQIGRSLRSELNWT